MNCTPSHPLAPVQWNSQFGDISESQAMVDLSPIQHTAEFTTDVPFYLTEMYTCDLINVDEPEGPVDPQMVNVRFISGALCEREAWYVGIGT